MSGQIVVSYLYNLPLSTPFHPRRLTNTTMFTPLFHSLLKFYHLFPLHSPVTLLYMDAPWGKFAYNEQRGREGQKAWGDLDGNLAWAFMEIVSVSLFLVSGYVDGTDYFEQPITFATTILRSGGFSKLSAPTLFAAVCSCAHGRSPSTDTF